MVFLLLLLHSLRVSVGAEVATKEGLLEGTLLREDVVAYLGVPYALPPTGNLRFESAHRTPLRQQTLKATEWPTRCFVSKSTVERESHSEDCLYINILVSSTSSQKQHLLAIFSNDNLDVTALLSLVTEDIAVAVIHFREGPLGFFLGEYDGGVSDVRMALSWLDDHKETFGFLDVTLLAQNDQASIVSHAVGDLTNKFKRAILLNGNSAVRRFAPKYSSAEPSMQLLRALQCNFTNSADSMGCMKNVPVEKIVDVASDIKWPEAVGAPFRPSKSFAFDYFYNVIFGVQSTLTDEYSSVDDFSVSYTVEDFLKFLGEVIPKTEYRNAALVRKLVYFQYLQQQRSAYNDTYFLWGQSRKILLERDFIVPTRKLAFSFDPDHNSVWLWEYPVKNPVVSCLQKEVRQRIAPFCTKMWEYFKRFAATGSPTSSGCDPTNPSWPAFRSTKRDYHIFLSESAQVDRRFDMGQAAFEFWNDLVTTVEQIELSGNKQKVLENFDVLRPEDAFGADDRTDSTERHVPAPDSSSHSQEL